MPFVQRARDFVERPEARHAAHAQYPIMRDTLRYMLDHAIGRENGISTNRIIEYLNEQGYDIDREDWQIQILGYLRQNGIYIGSLRGPTGMFLIENEADAHAVYNSIRERISTEQERLDILAQEIRNVGWTV